MKTITNTFRGALMMLLITTVLASCSSGISVQKRHHTKGYHVELAKKKNDKSSEQQTEAAVVNPTIETENAVVTTVEPTAVELPGVTIIAETETVAEEAVATEKQLTKKELKAEIKEVKKLIAAEDMEQIKATTATPEPQNTKEGKVHWAAILSFIFGVLAIISPLILGLIAIVLGAVALGAIKDSGGKYKGKGYATAGIILGAFWILIIFLLFTLILAAL